ncbi:hypothetical protein FI667_g7336, partial [Globisporangium splendens]
MYGYTKDTLAHVCAAIMRILHLNQIMHLVQMWVGNQDPGDEANWTVKIDNVDPNQLMRSAKVAPLAARGTVEIENVGPEDWMRLKPAAPPVDANTAKMENAGFQEPMQPEPGKVMMPQVAARSVNVEDVGPKESAQPEAEKAPRTSVSKCKNATPTPAAVSVSPKRDKLGDIISSDEPEGVDTMVPVHEFSEKDLPKPSKDIEVASFPTAAKRNKIGGMITFFERPDRFQTATPVLLTTANKVHALPDNEFFVETPEVYSLMTPPVESKPVVELFNVGSDAKVLDRSESHPSELERASMESNATDDAEDDRIRDLSPCFASSSPEMMVGVMDPFKDTARDLQDLQEQSSIALSEANMSTSWSSSSSDEDRTIDLYSAPCFMPPISASTLLSL